MVFYIILKIFVIAVVVIFVDEMVAIEYHLYLLLYALEHRMIAIMFTGFLDLRESLRTGCWKFSFWDIDFAIGLDFRFERSLVLFALDKRQLHLTKVSSKLTCLSPTSLHFTIIRHLLSLHYILHSYQNSIPNPKQQSHSACVNIKCSLLLRLSYAFTECTPIRTQALGLKTKFQTVCLTDLTIGGIVSVLLTRTDCPYISKIFGIEGIHQSILRLLTVDAVLNDKI